MSGLEKIKTRGYDGAGLATMAPTGAGGMVSHGFGSVSISTNGVVLKLKLTSRVEKFMR